MALLEPYCVLREGLRSILAKLPGLRVIGHFSSLSRFLLWYPKQKIDVVLIGYHLHNVASMSWLQFCRRHNDGAAILVLNGMGHPRHARAALEMGAQGVIDLQSSTSEIEQAVRALAAGRRYTAKHAAHTSDAALHDLSSREFDVLMLTAMGFRLKEIADRLGVVAQTANSYRRRVCLKLGLKTSSEVVRFACDHGLLTQDICVNAAAKRKGAHTAPQSGPQKRMAVHGRSR